MIYVDYIEFDEKINYNTKFVDIGWKNSWFLL
jgi:hypothetical protein